MNVYQVVSRRAGSLFGAEMYHLGGCNGVLPECETFDAAVHTRRVRIRAIPGLVQYTRRGWPCYNTSKPFSIPFTFLYHAHVALVARAYNSCVVLGDQGGKWAARTIRFAWNGIDSLEDGTPLGGAIVWNSKSLFPREQREVRIADIAKVEHSGNVSTYSDQAGRVAGREI